MAILNPPLIELSDVSKHYSRPAGSPVSALSGVSCRIPTSGLTAIVGKSGSGKSTLGNLIAGLDRPSSGAVKVGDISLSDLNEDQLATWRGTEVGVVFQFFQLLPVLTVLENILLAMDFAAVVPRQERGAKALDLLDEVGIADQAGKLPDRLSGGQQQRAAVARALANDPNLVIADEPTGNLDSESASLVVELLRSLASNRRSVVVITHDESIVTCADALIRLSDGTIVEDTTGKVVQ